MTSSTPNSPKSDGQVGLESDDLRGRDEGMKASATGARRVDELESRVTELEDLWRRALADLDNLRKRQARESARAITEERMRVAAQFLDVIDDLDRALAHAQRDPASVLEGITRVRDEAVDIIARLGFPRRDDLGATFDPSRHDAVATAPNTEYAPGTVIDVVRPGYGEGETQLRPAAVVVATGPT